MRSPQSEVAPAPKAPVVAGEGPASQGRVPANARDGLLRLQRRYGNRGARGIIQAKLDTGPVDDRTERPIDRGVGQAPGPPARRAPGQVRETAWSGAGPAVARAVTPARDDRRPVPDGERVPGAADAAGRAYPGTGAGGAQNDAPGSGAFAAGADVFVQRCGADLGGAHAGASSGERRSLVTEVLRGSGRPLDGTVRMDMEARLGADFSDVRLHAGPTAQRSAAELGARAYTSGSHIVFGSGGTDRHTLAHELTHVIQQRQGPVAGIDRGDGLSVSDPSDRFERAAEANARRALAGSAPVAHASAPREVSAGTDTPADSRVQRTAGPRSGGPVAVQRLGDGEVIFDHAAFYAKPDWQKAAKEFERRLGGYAFNDPRSLAAARQTVQRLRDILKAYAVEEGLDPKKVDQSFFTDQKDSAGQVGVKVAEEIDDFFSTSGNVRELMTAIYNASFYGKNGSADEVSLKAVLRAVMGPHPEYASNLGMNEEELKKHSAVLKSGVRSLVNKVPKVGYNYADDPYALGNIIWQSKPDKPFGDSTEMALSQFPRRPRGEKNKKEHKTPKEYADLGAPLSERELNLAGELGPKGELPWVEGDVHWWLDEKSYYAKWNTDVGIPVVAGMSGTTTRMLKTFQWSNVSGVDPFDFRMALMGWMLPSWDHSLYEILRGSWVAGVKGPRESVGMTSGGAVAMYQNIEPFTEEELRENVCVDRMFPHERMYVAEATKKRDEDPTESGFMEPSEMYAGIALDKYEEFIKGGSAADIARRFTPAHAVALLTYTSPAHQMINTVARSRLLPEGYIPFARSMPTLGIADSLARGEIVKQLKRAARDATLPALSTIEADPVIGPLLGAARAGDVEALKIIDARIEKIAPVLFEELKAHTDMVMEALWRLPGVTGPVFRGDWMAGGVGPVTQFGGYLSPTYGRGSIFTVSFDSTSRKEDVAKGFMRGQKVNDVTSHRVLLELDLKGKYGRDIEPFHIGADEDEVLLMPGARFKVTKSEWREDGTTAAGSPKWYERITAVEA